MKRMFAVLVLGMALVSCTTTVHKDQNARSSDPEIIVGKTWQWISTISPVEKITVTTPDRYTILLHPDGKIQALSDCNRGGGNYEFTKGKLSFGPMMSTRMACPPDTLDAQFMRDLQRVNSFFLEGGQLYLELPLDSGTMRFKQAH